MAVKKQYKTLSLEERVHIACLLREKKSVTEIGRELGRSASTILREIKNYAVIKESDKNNCQFYMGKTCDIHNLCSKECGSHKACRLCKVHQCNEICPDYSEAFCDRLCESPYVCNGCGHNNSNCRFNKRIYDPSAANKKAGATKHNKATGYDYTDQELDIINGLISPLILNGQSPYAALVTVKADLDENGIHISKSTLYRMINRRDLDCRNIDLQEKVKRRRPRTKKRNRDADTKVMIDKAGHMWEDYNRYMESHDLIPVQMDCVEGKRSDKCALLTLYWKDTHVQVAFIMDAHDSKRVVEALDKLEIMIGLDMFRRMLPVILTDNGQEFTDIEGMERSCTASGEKRTIIFFCEPNRSDQKGGCEKNYREMRKIIPKGKTTMDDFDQSDICLMMDHVNSYPRESLHGKTPYEAAEMLYPKDFIDDLNFIKIPPKELEMKPSLLRRRVKARQS